MSQRFHYFISNSNDLQNFPRTTFDIEAALATKFDPEVQTSQQCYWHGSRVTRIIFKKIIVKYYAKLNGDTS